MMLHTGTTLDQRYRIDYVIKQGGMGTVYGAHDLRLDRPCAVKAVPVTSARESTQIQREARVLGRLCHPRLPAIHDCLVLDGVVFVIMQMIPGDDLEGVALRNGLPAWDMIVGWAIQLGDAVQYLHEQSPPVIHRDIKPANIRLAPHGQIYLVDFGIAKELDGAATVTAARAASVPYAPIEQLQDGSHTSQQSDLYAFGATLYRLLTATLPPSCVDRLVGKDLPPVSALNSAVPPALDTLVQHCLELWSADRPASMASVIARLQTLRGVLIEPPSESHTLPARSGTPAPMPAARPVKPAPEAQAAYEAGRQALEQGDVTAARKHFTRAIGLAESYADAYAGRATAHLGLGLMDAAKEDWDTAIAHQPRCATWYLRRAALHRQRHDTTAAITDLSTAIEIDPEHADAYWERAAVRRDAGDTRGYIQDLDRLLILAPSHVPARVARARSRMQQQLWQSALSDCNALIEANPLDTGGYLLRARIHTELGDTTRALRDLGDALTADPDASEAYFLRGRLLQRSGDRQAALRDFNLALEIDSEYIEARYRRAQLLRALSNERDALGDYRSLARLLRSRAARRAGAATRRDTPSTRRPVIVEVQYLMQTAGIEKARKYLHREAASFREDNDEELEERAALYERVGQLDAALDDMERAIKLLLARQNVVPQPFT